MFRLINQVFTALLRFGRPLVTKCVSLNNKPCMIRPLYIDLNSTEFDYYLFMTSLDKCNESCNAVDDLSMKVCVPSKNKT